ncbi:MAG TPA: GNAT family N-acetyltransferase [Thermoanaerobaculia bacterium]|jgi:aminoglycoside 6'-N-acetyltransferase I
MHFRILDLTSDRPDFVNGAAALLHNAFRHRTHDWQDLDSAREEVLESLNEGRISRVAVDESLRVLGWIGALPMYSGHVWEIHPLVVGAEHRRQGIGRALVRDLETIVSAKGALTLWAGSDDENNETSLSAVDLYEDLPGAIRDVRNFSGHPYEFYVRLGFKIVGVIPDANGAGKPDIFLAKRVTRAG